MLWPEFNVAELEAALTFFSSRDRRFGLTQEQLSNPAGRPGRAGHQ
jgi:hypothetical protein